MGRHLSLLRSYRSRRFPGVHYDAASSAYFTAIAGAGGSISVAHKAAVDAFVLAAKGHSYWTKLKRLNLFAGNQLAAALVPLLAGGPQAADTNHGFVSGDYTPTTGLTGDNSAKYLSTGWVPSVELVTSLDSHFGCYILDAPDNSTNRSILGAYSDGFANGQFHQWQSGGASYYAQDGDNSMNASYSEAAPPTGHLVTTVRASGAGGTYKNAASQSGIPNATSSVLATIEMFVFGINTGSLNGPSALRLGAYHFGTGLTAQNITDLYADLGAFFTAIGRS